MKPRLSRCSCTMPKEGLNRDPSLHFRHGKFMSLRLFRCMSTVARSTYLSMTLSLIQMTIVLDLMHDKTKLIRTISVFTENFGMTFAKKVMREWQEFAKTEMNQHFGKILPTHFHVTTHLSVVHIQFHRMSSHACMFSVQTHNIYTYTIPFSCR